MRHTRPSRRVFCWRAGRRPSWQFCENEPRPNRIVNLLFVACVLVGLTRKGAKVCACYFLILQVKTSGLMSARATVALKDQGPVAVKGGADSIGPPAL